MDRVERTERTMRQLGIDGGELTEAFPEFAQVKERFVYGDTWSEGELDVRRRLLVSIACLVTVEGDDLEDMLRAALRQGLDPAALQEVFHQAAPYIGFPKAQKGLVVLGRVLDAEGVALPLDVQGTVTEADRLEVGIDAQKSLFGPAIDAMRASAPADHGFIQDYLSAYCFGDTYTRGAIDLQTRELLTFACIISLGGCDPQAKAHVGGNLAAGNDKTMLLNVVAQCVPYIGFPRSLNAIAAIDEVVRTMAEQS